jgi:succinate dehydrogenase / fumarate reductase iron-sulfur subunit
LPPQAAEFAAAEAGGWGDIVARGRRKDVYQAEEVRCGACVAACKNASAMLFTAAKVSHLAMLP